MSDELLNTSLKQVVQFVCFRLCVNMFVTPVNNQILCVQSRITHSEEE